MPFRLQGQSLRFLLTINQVMLWISAVIVMGITSYFIHKTPSPKGEHLIYVEVISTMSVAFYIPALFVPLMKWYKGHMLALNVIFSYLWLTAFIFEAQDYDWHSCSDARPFGHCSTKRADEAFTFLAFFFSFTAIALEGWMLKELVFPGHAATATNGVHKEEAPVTATNGTDAAATA